MSTSDIDTQPGWDEQSSSRNDIPAPSRKQVWVNAGLILAGGIFTLLLLTFGSYLLFCKYNNGVNYSIYLANKGNHYADKVIHVWDDGTVEAAFQNEVEYKILADAYYRKYIRIYQSLSDDDKARLPDSVLRKHEEYVIYLDKQDSFRNRLLMK